MGGQIRMRVHYRQFRSPYFDYLLVSQSEMKRLVAGTGWVIRRVYESAAPNYIAILSKDA